jgi:hypothetical protein
MTSVRTTSLLRTAWLAAGGLLLANTLIVGCSSSSPPPVWEPSGGSRLDGGDPESGSRIDAGRLDDAAEGDSSQSPDTDAEVEDPNCLDDKVATIDGGDGTCPTSGPCSAACADMFGHFKVGVAMFAASCIAKIGASCDPLLNVIPCVDQAIERACKDPSSTAYCTPLVTSCDPDAGLFGNAITQDGCEEFASAFSSAGRATFKACIEDKIAAGTCEREVVTCADEIRR